MEQNETKPAQIEQRKLFAWLWTTYLKKHVWMLALVVILMVTEGAMMGGLAWMLQPLFDRVFVGGSMTQLYLVGGIVFALFLARATLSIVHRLLMTTISRKSVADLQNNLLR
ncbi:MAG: ABC transporter ATP-binding protein, partial [Planktomarina sp.]